MKAAAGVCSRRALGLALGFGLAAWAAEPGDERWDFRFGLRGTLSSVLAATSWNGQLCIGGYFETAGGSVAKRVAVWDGVSWQGLGDGISGSNATVLALAVDGPRVVVGGQFQFAGGQPANNVALWDGSRWTALGHGDQNGVSGGSVNALAMRGTNIYVAGTFTNAGSVSVRSLARWDGARWTRLGSGINNSAQRPRVFALALDAHALWVGGLIHWAGNKGVSGLARWVDQPHLTLGAPQLEPGGYARLRLTGPAGLRFVVQTSPDLATWQTTRVIEALEDAMVVEVPADGLQQFYRARLEP